ncbi:MAG: mandelate racemase/muconate lactonizing enzyme family protein [Devosia sp.]|nr:mandelate racemase/muconate lactonizing enzyme family protein [Devosia sp.]
MRIDDIRVTTLVFAYPEQDRFRYAGGRCTHRVTSLIEVVADDGTVGIGSAYSHPRLVEIVVADQLLPLLRGEAIDDVRRLWRAMYAGTRWFGRKGAVMSAIGAVEVALWDLLGKQLGLPVHRLLGGDGVRSVPAYASALLWADHLPDLTPEAERHRNNGFRRMKMRLGRSSDYDLAALDAVISGAGSDAEVIVDGSMRYTVDQARLLSTELARRKVFWFEEPLQPEDIDGFVALRPQSAVPVAAGENEFGVQGFAELLRSDAVDIVQPDVSRCGGIGEARAVAELAARAGKRFAPHSWSDAIAVMANAHVVASMPNGITVEIDQSRNPFVDQLLVSPLTVRDGLLNLPDAPGLGIELRREVVERYRLPSDATPPAGTYSDMIFGGERLHQIAPYG